MALALGIDAIVGIRQPTLQPGPAEGILRTFDEEGRVHESRLAVVDDGGTLWIQSAHHFRGWYQRLLLNPDVELVRDGEVSWEPADDPTRRALATAAVAIVGILAARSVLNRALRRRHRRH